MKETSLRAARIASVVAATIISLACGTNYAYSAWAPQFAERLKLSSTQINLIGTCGNLGMYLAGVPIGMFVDSRGPRPGAFIGAVALGSGYLGMFKAYNAGAGAVAVPWLCFFSFSTGIGGCAAFSGSIKTCALNWPSHRGTATAFPLAAFGLSALFFATISSVVFPDNTSDLLLLLAILTFLLCIIGVLFLQIVPPQGSSSLRAADQLSVSGRPTLLKRTSSIGSKGVESRFEIGTQSEPNTPLDEDSRKKSGDFTRSVEESSSLLSKSSASSLSDPLDGPQNVNTKGCSGSRDSDIRGLAMLKTASFYYLWVQLGLLTGVGVMTINNIGNNAKALWHHYDASISPKFIQERQLMHVEILSLMSFCGRLASGIGSDLIVRKLGASRFWCLFISSCIFFAAQISGFNINNPHLLALLSGLTGLAYGFLFGVYPTLVAETFGVHGLSQNWGCMTLAPVVSSNFFNLLYGRIYDQNSLILPDGQRDCGAGLDCYRGAYFVTLCASLVGVGISLWTIRHDWASRKTTRERLKTRDWEA